MSIDRINLQLGKLGLASAEDDMPVGALQFGTWIVFGDQGGDTLLIAQHDDVQREFNRLMQERATLSKEFFWEASWLGQSLFFRGYDEWWSALPMEACPVSVSIPRSSEKQGIGRAKRLGKEWWLFESDNGEYGLVPVKETGRWIISG